MPVNQFSGELLAESPAAVAEVLLGRVQAALEACATSEPLIESYVTIGELAWDDCCGVLAAAPIRSFPTRSFPLSAADVTNCDSTLLAVDVTVVLLRCMPVIDDQGNPPSPDDIALASMGVSGDAAVIYNTLMGDLPDGWERANVEQTFSGAQGGCIAIDTRITIGLPQSEWCACEVVP